MEELMASWWSMSGALLLLVLLLLPIHLLSLGLRLLRRPVGRRLGALRSILLLVSMPLLLSAIFTISDVPSETEKQREMIELEQMKLQIARLESILEVNTKTLESKSLHEEENNKLIDEMEQKIQLLQNALDDIQRSSGGSSYSEEMVNFMEEKVQKLWAESRRNNFNIHNLQSKAYDTEQKLEAVALEVQKMENIVTEQWIQIRQLEQALQMTKMMASKVRNRSTSRKHRKNKPMKCTMLKFMKKLRHHYLPEAVGLPDSFFLGKSISSSFLSQAFDRFRKILSAARSCHHELQYLIKRAMEMNEYTAALANEEVIFFLASAILTFPIMSAWILCSS